MRLLIAWLACSSALSIERLLQDEPSTVADDAMGTVSYDELAEEEQLWLDSTSMLLRSEEDRQLRPPLENGTVPEYADSTWVQRKSDEVLKETAAVDSALYNVRVVLKDLYNAAFQLNEDLVNMATDVEGIAPTFAAQAMSSSTAADDEVRTLRWMLATRLAEMREADHATTSTLAALLMLSFVMVLACRPAAPQPVVVEATPVEPKATPV